MVRRAGTASVLVGLACALGVTGACGTVSVEEKIIRDFFRASRIRDEATLGTFATTTFDPRKDGQVQSFTVASIGDEVSHPLPLKEYAAAVDKAREAEAAFAKEKYAYQQANIAAIERVLKAEGARQPVRGRDATVQAAWSKWRTDSAQHTKAISDARARLNSLRGLAELSLAQPTGPTPDVTRMDGTLVEKDVTIEANVRTPDGATATRTLIVTLERTIMKEDGAAEPRTGRWLVTHVREPGQPKTS